MSFESVPLVNLARQDAPAHKAMASDHLYVVETANRREIQAALEAAGIASDVHYPISLHQQPYFSDFGYRSGQFPVTKRAASRVLSPPICSALTPTEVAHVGDVF